MPTASAVVGDVFDCVRNILADCCGRIGCTCYKDLPVRKISDIRSKYFVRMEVEDRSGVLASVAAVFGNNDVSIAQVMQKRKRSELAEIVVITETVQERHFMDAIRILEGMSLIRNISSPIRVYD